MNKLLDAREIVSPFVEAGLCPGSEMVDKRINEAQRRLLTKGDWKYTLTRMRFCTDNNSITLPREVETALTVDIDLSPRRIFGHTYEFLEGGPGEVSACSNTCSKDLEDLGNGWPVFFDIPGSSSMKLMALSTEAADESLKMRIPGINPLSTDTT